MNTVKLKNNGKYSMFDKIEAAAQMPDYGVDFITTNILE